MLLLVMMGTEVCTELSSELLKFLHLNSSTKDKTSAIVFDNGAYRPKIVDNASLINM